MSYQGAHELLSNERFVLGISILPPASLFPYRVEMKITHLMLILFLSLELLLLLLLLLVSNPSKKLCLG